MDETAREQSRSAPNRCVIPGQGRAGARAAVDGKFFRVGSERFSLKGVTYGPFAPKADGDTFATPEQTARDFAQLRSLNVNLLRVYHVPPGWWLDLAEEHGLKALIDIPWGNHTCFLDSRQSQRQARQAVIEAVRACQGRDAVFGYSVVNEIPAEIVRWSGPQKVAQFIDELVAEAKSIDPEALCTFCSFPPTEFLQPQNTDFMCFNVYLHQRGPFQSYLARLQMLAGNKPLILGEFGMDSRREGEAAQCEFLGWQIETAFRAGLAGTVVFSYTDDWLRGGRQIEDWAFGVTTRERQPKASFSIVQRQYQQAPCFPLARAPKVSIVVASFNAARTLKRCLDSLVSLNYPDYEVILVDDGSTDDTPQIAQLYQGVRYLRQINLGLSAARNAGIEAATGEIIAFTDADCRADRDWLYYLIGSLVRSDFAAMGGPNLLPPEDSDVAAAVMASPGGPAHVMLTDCEAEHIPGCNMAFFKWALEEIGGFDAVFRRAGDDVDVCWRLLKSGRIGFNPAGFVWHYRRSTVVAYLKQQFGYGEAEALLARKHPEYFNWLGGGVWRGRIYAAGKVGVLTSGSVIYHGLFGGGFFQKLYAAAPALAPMVFTSLPYHAFVTLPLMVLSTHLQVIWPVTLASILASFGVCAIAAVQADLPKKKRRRWSRLLVALLFFLQPIVRGWARYKWAWSGKPVPLDDSGPAARLPPLLGNSREQTTSFWSSNTVDRFAFLDCLIARLRMNHWEVKLDSGFNDYDLEVTGSNWARLRLTTVAEALAEGQGVLRCRSRSHWNFRGHAAFWLIVASVLAIVGVLARIEPWLWMLPVTLPVLQLFFNAEKRRIQRLLAVMLEEVARELGWVKLK